MDLDAARFEELVGEALDLIPDALADRMDNLVVQVSDWPAEPGLLGLYEGIPLTEREEYGGFALPDRITIFRYPILARCRSEVEVRDEVAITVVHEIAHHFGVDDHRLGELGWD